MFGVLSSLVILMSCSMAFSKPALKSPSSEIPAKREFPLSQKLNPCDNFHHFVCSEVEASFKLREDRSSHDFAFNDSYERLLLEKRKFLKNVHKEKNLSPRAESLKNNYLACIDTRAGAIEEKKWISNFSSELDALKSIENFQRAQYENLKTGRPTIWEVGQTENVDNPLIYDLYIGVSFMMLPDHSYYENAELVAAHKSLMVEFFNLANPKDKVNSEKKAEAILQLEKDFIKIYPRSEVRRQRWDEKRQITKSEFEKAYPNLMVKELFQTFPDKVYLRVPIPEALKFYNDLLVDSKYLETLKDFLFFASGSSLMDAGYPSYFKKYFEFRRKFYGGPEKRPVTEERCTMSTMSTFSHEIDEVLLPRLFPKFPEDQFRNLVEKVRASIISGLEKNQWLSSSAKAEALEKMKTARLQLVKPQNENEWDFHPLATYSPKEKIGNSEKLQAVEFEETIKQLHEPVNIDRWNMGPLTINASYNPSFNKFTIPQGILQFPFYDPSSSEIENLASVGAVVGHELGHGIDDSGSRYDHKGQLKQWMSMKDLAEFTKRSTRLVEVFDKIGHNGKLTLGENVADLVGVTFAYQAAFPTEKANPEDQKKFFQNYARLWCQVERPQFSQKRLKTDPHSLGWARINEPLKHQKAFAEVFNCKEGDKMYLPESQRISIW